MKTMSRSQVKRLIKQGAVEVNGKKIYDIHFKIRAGDMVKVGKTNFIKVV